MSDKGERGRFFGYVANISESGAFVQCSNPKVAGSEVVVELKIFGPRAPGICCVAEVVWVRGYAGSTGPSAGMGIEFRQMDKDTRSALATFCIAPDPSEPPLQAVFPASP